MSSNQQRGSGEDAVSDTGSQQPRRPPMWKLGAFWSLTADPFLDSNDGVPPSDIVQSCALLGLMLNECPRLSPWSGQRQSNNVSLNSLLQNCGRFAHAASEIGDSVDKFNEYVDDFLGDIGKMKVGGIILIPGGWTGPTGTTSIIYIAECKPDATYSVTVCNASPDGLSYHPAKVHETRPAEKILYRSCLVIDNISKDRFLDKTFWAVTHSLWIKPSEFHRAEVLYDVLLPWLSNEPTLHNALQKHYNKCTASVFTANGGGMGEHRNVDSTNTTPISNVNSNNTFWRTPMRSASSSPMRNVIEAARYYLVRHAGCNHSSVKRFTTILKAEALGMALSDLNDDQVEEPPNNDEKILLELSCQTVAHASLKVAETEGWGAADVVRLIENVKSKLDSLDEDTSLANAKIESDKENFHEGTKNSDIRPDPFTASDLSQEDSSFRGIRISNDDTEQYAGPATEPRTTRVVDFLKVVGDKPVRTVEEAVATLQKCKRVCDDLNERCRDGSSYSSRVCLQLQVAQIICYVVTEALPIPIPNPVVLAAQRGQSDGTSDTDSGGPGTLWSRGFPSRDLQLTCLSLIYQLTLTYAWAWQSFDAPTRSFESEKAIVSLSLLSIFDCVLRHDRFGIDTASVLREDGGFSVSTSVCVANLSLYRFAGVLELHSPALALARSNCLEYFEAVQRSSKYTDLFAFQMPTDKIEVKKYGTSILFLRKLMERCGYELVPRDNPEPPPEIESLMQWLTSPGTPLAQDHREFGMLRDMVCLYKFLATMETRQNELQRQRVAASDYVSWSLSFEETPVATSSGTLRGSRTSIRRGLGWEVLNYRGLDLDTADVLVTLSDRKVFFGDGVVNSPVDIVSLLNHKSNERPTEDDVLHADSLPSYGDILSRQESEMLMSYLTVPYMRIPLCLAFFATGDRVTYLFSYDLRALLRSVLFDAADWVPKYHTPNVTMVPVASGGFRSKLDEIMVGGQGLGNVRNAKPTTILGTNNGLLLNELRNSPEGTLRPLMKMLKALNDMAKASVFSPDASLSLYLIEIALDVQAFFPSVRVGEEHEREMTRFLTMDCRRILQNWLIEAAAADDLETMCMIHSYLALIWTHMQPRDITPAAVTELMGSLCFVRNWHGFGFGDPSAFLGYGSSTESTAPPEQRLLRFMQAHGVNIERITKGSLSKYLGHSRPLYLRVGTKTFRVPNLGPNDDSGEHNASTGKRKEKGKLAANVPEQKLVAMLQMQRKHIVVFLDELGKTSTELTNRILSEICTIALDTKANWILGDEERLQKRAKIAERGDNSWTILSRGVWLSPDKEMTLDLQSSQVMWRNDELKPLPDSFTIMPDYRALFGRQQLHSGLVALQQHRHWLHVVGTCYDLILWDEPDDMNQGIDCPRVIQTAAGAPHTNTTTSTQSDGNAGDADDLKSKSPSAIEYKGVCFDRELNPFNEESIKSFSNEEESWTIKLLVAGLRGHYKEKLPFKVLLPANHVSSDDHTAFAMAGVVNQYDSEDKSDRNNGPPSPMRGRNNGSTFSLMSRPGSQQQYDGQFSTTWKEFVMFKDTNILQVFNLQSHGRKMYRQLVYSSDIRLALHSLEPSKSLFGAGGDLKVTIPPDPSLAISRNNGICTETLVPGRLLAGTVPGALIEAYRFWHSSLDDVIRGEPYDPDSTWFGDSVLEISPDRTIIQRYLTKTDQMELKKKLSAGITDSVGDATSRRRIVVESSTNLAAAAAADTEDKSKEQQISETAVLDLVALGFSSAAARLALTKKNGNSVMAAEWLFDPSNAAQVSAAEDREQVDRVLFRVVAHDESIKVHSAPTEEPKRHYWRTHDASLGYGEEITVVERSGNWLRFEDPQQPDKDCWVLAFHPEKGTLLEAIVKEEEGNDLSFAKEAVVAAKEAAEAVANEEKPSAMDIDDESDGGTEGRSKVSKLVNLLDFPKEGDGLSRLLSLLTKIENISHILVWANTEDDQVTRIELPRLKLKMEPRDGHRLFLTDQAGWFICDQTQSTRRLLDCHSLLLMNQENEMQFLVPNYPTTRARIKGRAFSTNLLCDRDSFSWLHLVDTRFYLYNVHTSGTFLVSQELAASIYLVHLKLSTFSYKEAFLLAPSCTVDVPHSPEESFMWQQLKDSMDDKHPNAHACRLRLSLAIMYLERSSTSHTPWELHHELDGYIAKLSRVSAACRLTKEEELKACQLTASGTPRIKNRLAALNCPSPVSNADFFSPTVRVGGTPWHKVQSRPLAFYDNHGTSLKRIHFKPEVGEGGFESFCMEVIFKELVVADEESGANRQLGFAFLYTLISANGNVGSNTKPYVTGDLLSRYLHLKLSRWGRESISTGEVEVASSRHMAQLSALLHTRQIQPQVQWPEIPRDEQSVTLASNGVNLYTEPGMSSGIKRWLENVDVVFQSIWPEIFKSNDAGCRTVDKQIITVPNGLRHFILPACIEDTSCNFRAFGTRNSLVSITMAHPLYNQHQKYLNEESSGKKTKNIPNEKLPFDLYQHPAAQPSVAKDILRRMEEDVKGYAVKTRQEVNYVLNSCEIKDLVNLMNDLEELGRVDLTFIQEKIKALERIANRIHNNSDLLKLKTQAMHRDIITFEILTQALLSSHASEDLKAVNPTLSDATIKTILEESVEVLVRVNRISHTSRTTSLTRKLLKIHQRENLADARWSFRAEQLSKDLATSLSSKRWYIQDGFDPRFLVFEYVFDILLRERQVDIVNKFSDDMSEGRSHVQQMIMGAGKTTVVAPLLTLLLADGSCLVSQVMPSALLEQTRHIMRSRFAAVIRKRVFTLEFDRGCEDDVEVARRVFSKLDEARRSRGVVCASPDALKSLFLKFIEHIHSLENVDKEVLTPSASLRQNKEIVALRQTMQSRSDMSDCLVPIFDLWREGVLIMDEVDILLHPLRSELNFPIGLKDPIDLAGFRWDLPIAILRVFFAEDAAEEIRSGHNIVDKEKRTSLLNEIQEIVEAGYTSHALQRHPHLVLLDEDFYRRKLRIPVSTWSAFWIIENCSDIPGDISLIAKYLYLDGIESLDSCSQDQELNHVRSAFAHVSGTSMKLLNLARDWIRILLPHVLGKIDRVSFGILNSNDLANVDQTRMPISRKLMAVPFVGKDVPSRSSEFAHPDVVIGLSILGFRYEGLRETDVRRIVMQLKADFARQVGPRDLRPASLIFRSWLENAASHLIDEEQTQQLPVLPLPLFQLNDPKQLKRLHQFISKEDRVITYYLQNHVFPACMNFQNIKISACGHELGSNMLFPKRIGFSGTPSNLLPIDLGQCYYEPGSDGKVMHVLSSPEVVAVEKKKNWTARSLLRDVATGSGGVSFHALIDTGALITGMDNEEVAHYLLSHLPASHFDGVVYLDRADRKMFLQRNSGKSLHLSQCGVDPSRRFTFYDQVHTTGMDIKQAPDARAVVTLGKDMTFRDYAQGSFRMRGIGNGQTICLYLTPEVEHLICAELHENKKGFEFNPLDVPAWLLVNSMKTETVQHSMLSVQELLNCWRKEALRELVNDVRVNSPLLPKLPGNQQKSYAQRLRRFLDDGPDSWLRKCIFLFREPVGFVVPDRLPAPKPFSEKVHQLIEENAHFMKTPAAQELVSQVAGRISYTKDLASEALEAEIVNENEQEQQQQQEEEAEEEQEKVSRFTRDDEQANPWSVSHLNEVPTCVVGDAPFYKFRDFSVRPEQPKLIFPGNILLSDNFFRPRWIGLGDRRLKNVMVVLEWYPASFKLLLAKLLPLLHQHLVNKEGLQPTPAALRALSLATMPTSDEEIALRKDFVDQLVTAKTCKDFGMGQNDAFYVAVSLAEAETLRRTIHLSDATSAFSLLSIEDSSCIDLSHTAITAISKAHLSTRAVALSCLRFVNGDMHYTSAELKSLQNSLAGSPVEDRIHFFEQCLSLRRREKYLWGDTPLAKLFTKEAEWHLLDARAKLQQFGMSLVRSLRLPGNTLDLLSVFLRLDQDGDGALSRGEMQRLLEEVRLGFSPIDISTIIKIIDKDAAHKISWETFTNALMIPPELRSRQPEDQIMEEEKTVWACSNCTFRFNDPTSQECEVCGYGWDGRLHVPPDKWMCDPEFGGCTFFNSKESFFCGVCDKSNPALRHVRF